MKVLSMNELLIMFSIYVVILILAEGYKYLFPSSIEDAYDYYQDKDYTD